MPKLDIEIINKLGLHARASAKLSQLASEYPCEVFLSKKGRRINAKSIMGVMMLAGDDDTRGHFSLADWVTVDCRASGGSGKWSENRWR